MFTISNDIVNFLPFHRNTPIPHPTFSHEFLTVFNAVAIMPTFAHDPIIWLPMSDMQQNIDYRQFLSDHPEVDQIELLLPDNNGVLRGKRVPADKLPDVTENGILLPGSTFALDFAGNCIDETGLVWDEGDSDRPCLPVAGSLSVIPWMERSCAQMLISMHEVGGQPFFADPRHALAASVKALRKIGLFPVVAVELEFYLIDRQATPDGYPMAPISPVTGLREQDTQVYGIDALADYDAFMSTTRDFAAAQNIPSDAMVAEYAPGQFEINLQHVNDPLAAGDHAILLKRIIKAAARQHSMDATFMAKPFAGQSGNGMHIHISLLNEHGENVFAGDGEKPNDYLKFAIGGLQETMAEAMAILLPNRNSYKRLETGTYAPTAPTWGINNRTVALRIPAGRDEARRIEYRVAGADANPYLVLATVLDSIHHGIGEQRLPSKITTGNGYEKHASTLPVRPDAAFTAFDEGAILRRYFGEDLYQVIGHCRRQEIRRFEAKISPLEHDRFLRPA